MKTNAYVQYLGKEVPMAELEKKAKDIWKEKGHLMKDLNSMDLYVKVEEEKCYYVLNETLSGSFSLNE